MGFAINTNNDALSTYRNLNMVQNSLSKSLEKLSSGLRINQAGDDAAGLTIATQLGSQVSGLQQASRNAQDGVSLLQTADGALGQAQSILGRLRDLAVQAGNDSNSSDARKAIKSEADSLVKELDRLGDSVNFNGTKLLAGGSGVSNLQFQIGANGDSQSAIKVDLTKADLKGVATALNTGVLTSGNSYAFATGKSFSDLASTTFTATSNPAGSTSTATVNLSGLTSFSAVVDKLNTTAGFSASFTANLVRSADGTPTGFTVAANDGRAVTSDQTAVLTGTAVSSSTTTGMSFDSAFNAQNTIKAIDDQIAAVSGARASIGALENRFASAISTISTSVTNLTAAKSRITDVDMAQEMVNYTRANVLSQSGTAMLAQANSMPQLALKLLG